MELRAQAKLKEHRFDIWDFIRSNNHLITLVTLIIIATIVTGGIFLRPSNLFSVITRATALGMIAIGQTLVILTAGIDLSVAANVGLCIGMMYLMQASGYGAGLMMVVGATTPAAVGLVNGLFSAYTGVPPFIVTLAMSMVVRAITLGGIQPGATVFEDVQIFINTRIMGHIPIRDQTFTVIVWVLGTAFWIIMLRYSRLGHNIYAIGGKERAAAEDASIGVHRVFAADATAGTPASGMDNAQAVSAECQRFLLEMDVDPRVWIHAMETPKEELFYFTPDEMIKLNLATVITPKVTKTAAKTAEAE